MAHSIQKTLVPIVQRSMPAFQIYGISEPSEKVGGDLLDAVELEGGDTIAYLADITGHGLRAGILMGAMRLSLLAEDGCPHCSARQRRQKAGGSAFHADGAPERGSARRQGVAHVRDVHDAAA